MEQTQRVVVLVWQDRQDDAGNEHELHDRPQVRVAQFLGDAVQLGLELQEHGHAAADGDGHRHRAHHHERSDGIHQEHGHVGGRAGPNVGRGLGEMPDDNQCHDTPQTGGHNPAFLKMDGQHGRNAAEYRDQREGAHAGDAGGGVFPLQSNQQAQ